MADFRPAGARVARNVLVKKRPGGLADPGQPRLGFLPETSGRRTTRLRRPLFAQAL
jgi:hypothetical protein